MSCLLCEGRKLLKSERVQSEIVLSGVLWVQEICPENKVVLSIEVMPMAIKNYETFFTVWQTCMNQEMLNILPYLKSHMKICINSSL